MVITGPSRGNSGIKYECVVYSAFVFLNVSNRFIDLYSSHSMIRVCLVGGKIEWGRGGEGISKWNSYLGHMPFSFPSYFLFLFAFFFFKKKHLFSFILTIITEIKWKGVLYHFFLLKPFRGKKIIKLLVLRINHLSYLTLNCHDSGLMRAACRAWMCIN